MLADISFTFMNKKTLKQWTNIHGDVFIKSELYSFISDINDYLAEWDDGFQILEKYSPCNSYRYNTFKI